MINIRTEIPGPKSSNILKELKSKNGGWAVPYPLVHSAFGDGAYTQDIDGNIFLDFASQIASNPLGYNNHELLEVVRQYNRHPIKFAGQDFCVEEHLELLNSLLSVSPSGMNQGFLINSGAEAVENAIKIAMRNRPRKQFSVSVQGAFHGRTLGALSLHHSKPLHREGYMLEANIEIPFDEDAGDKLQETINEYGDESVSLVILEHFQGEGGYRMPPKKMVNDLRRITKKYDIPYIADEVQAGMGRTGKWWAFEHYGIKPDIFSAAKALQVGAVVANKKWFPDKPGAISSTWGGGHILDMAIGVKTIEIIKKEKLLKHNRIMGEYCVKRLSELSGIDNIRGRGLMVAFDLPNAKTRDNVIIECVKNGLLILGAGEKSIRIIPPFIIGEKEIDEGISIIQKAVNTCVQQGFRHKGDICKFMDCGMNSS